MGLLSDLTLYVDSLKKRGGQTLGDLASDPVGLLSRNVSAYSESLPAMPGEAQSGLLNRPGLLDWGMNVAANNNPASGLLGTTKQFKYAPAYRPPTSTNMPKGFSEVGPPTKEHKFGTVAYGRPLTSQELDSFELLPLDPKHPRNVKKSYEGFKERFMNDFSESGVFDVKGRAVVTNSARPEGGFQVTYMDGAKPTGHEFFNDFDDLSRFVWGMTQE